MTWDDKTLYNVSYQSPKLTAQKQFNLRDGIIENITIMVREMNYTHLRSNLKEAFDEVCNTHEPLYVKRQRHKSVVILSMDDWQSMQETFYLLKSPANAKRLIKAAASDRTNNIKTSVKELRDEFGITS